MLQTGAGIFGERDVGRATLLYAEQFASISPFNSHKNLVR